MRTSIALALVAAPALTPSAEGLSGGSEPPGSDVFRMEELADGVRAALMVDRPPVYAFANLVEEGLPWIGEEADPAGALTREHCSGSGAPEPGSGPRRQGVAGCP